MIPTAPPPDGLLVAEPRRVPADPCATATIADAREPIALDPARARDRVLAARRAARTDAVA